jgi:hypothetical protein
MPTLDDVLAQLATAPPTEFNRERNAVVARLTKLGQKVAAARVKAVPPPTAPVWVVNRLAREEGKSVEQLITATGHVRMAQFGRGDLRSAKASYQAALMHLSERAGAILREAGLGATHQALLRVETTLTAAATDPDLRSALRQGRLERELAARGFEVFAGEKLPPAPRDPAKTPAPKAGAVPMEQAPTPSSAKIAPAEWQTARLSKAREDLGRVEAEVARRRENLTAASQRVAELRRTLQEAVRAEVNASKDERAAAKALRAAQDAVHRAEAPRSEGRRKRGRA